MAGQNHELILRTLLDSIVEQLNYEDFKLNIKAVNSAGANYTSKLFAVSISGKEREDLKVFAKVALMGKTLRSQVKIRLYETEIFFYNELANLYYHIQTERAVEDEYKIAFPKFYGYNGKELEETVVLEDLTARGFSCHSRFESIYWDYAKKAVEEMAKMHSLSMALAKEKPNLFSDLMKNYKFDPMENKENVNKYWSNMLKQALEACTEHNKKLLELHYKDVDGEKAFVQMRRTLKRPILIHSDFRPSNLMHKVNKDGSMDMVIIDFQLVQAGCPVYDLLFFLVSGSDANFRRVYQDQLKEHYFQYLRESLKRLGITPDDKYSRKDFEYEWQEMLPAALTMAILSLPIITVDEEYAPIIDHNTDMDGFAVRKTSELYAKRLNEIIEDLQRVGILRTP